VAEGKWQKAVRKHANRPLFSNIDTIEPRHAFTEPPSAPPAPTVHADEPLVGSASGEKAKARDILEAIRIVKQIEEENRIASKEEKQALRRFGGFGPVALSLFPDPITGKYKDTGWETLGRELESLLSPEEHDSAKRTTFNAFYTSPEVINGMHDALDRLGVGPGSLILEPGCGIGNFLGHSRNGSRYIGVELDRTSGQIARALHPEHDIRVENFRDTRLPEGKLDAVIGNVPFASIKLEHRGHRFALHDYFFAKSVDALRPGGILALVTSRFTLDKHNAAIREYLAERADFLGAIRLPAEAFKREGTRVVTDIVFLRKREPGQPAAHADPDWLGTGTLSVEGSEIAVNRYFLNRPDMVLGDYSLANQLYAHDGFSVKGNGPLDERLKHAIARLPEFQTVMPEHVEPEPVPARFTRPPPLRHLGEGSFFIGDDQTILRIQDGAPRPVTHGGTVLRADGTMMGKRLAALIRLRDGSRLVLQSQNEDWPPAERQATRRELNRLHDAFTSQYGPINKTTFSATRDGTAIRRMPNLVTFREDPDAMLVMSLEEYDEVSGKASKASIFSQDVIVRKPPVSSVRSAAEGLLVSLDRSGRVDLPLIAGLYGKPEHDVIAELGDLIYRNPDSRQWETADLYLSGDVRAKLVAASQAGPEFARNAARLLEVQPPDIMPGDINAKLGSPWIPASDVQAFAEELFGVPEGAVRVGHLRKDATWSLDADFAAERSVAATAEYGTARANGTTLLEQALNMKSPVIHDTIRTDSGESRVVNQEETLAAREKQKLIKEKFKSWVFADPERAERLVRVYNDTYNNLRPRLFDGSHLELPEMNETVCLRPHQKDAIWRGMSSGNTLLAHAVGAGKTFTMAATGMKLKQAGLVHKPMYVVPNHMLEQFAREFIQLYPNARLLVASKEDLGKERRKFLTAKIASGRWDGIIVTHGSFERIGMSRDYQAQFLREQIVEYDALLADAAQTSSGNHRNLIKTIEKQKAARENRLKDLLAEKKKDDGLVFDELGVDHLFVDEAHYFKNLETPTKMDRVAGVQTGGSQRAFDLHMKARYLDTLHPGHGVTFATGTPISNTMVEMYNMQRFLDPKGLVDRGIEHFDGWAANFGEVVDSMEISPDGQSLKTRSRFARFNNLPELTQMFRAFADVQTAEDLDLPRPRLKDGKPATVSRPMSDHGVALQRELVARYERIRSQKVDPREDNALAITTDGRKLALDARMLDADALDDPDSKINALVENVQRIWRESESTKGTQMIFCDMGVQPTKWGFSAYDDIIRKLVASGIPRDQIATMGDAESDAKKQALFEKVRNGSVRILIGSTQKMGTGTNVQRRLVALHHLDAPWKPAEVEQRDGRILRQGNQNPEVAIYRYVTQGSFDSYMWQTLETKARFISQIMSGRAHARSADDIGGQELSYAEVKAIASGNPDILTLAEADAELQRLQVLRKSHDDEQFLARRKIRELPRAIESLVARSDNLKRDMDQIASSAHPEFTINGQTVARDDVSARLAESLKQVPEFIGAPIRIDLGKFHGLTFGLDLSPSGPRELRLSGATTRRTTLSRDATGPRAILNALNRMAASYREQSSITDGEIQLARQQLHDYQVRLGALFPHQAHTDRLRQLRDQLKLALSSPPSPESDEQPPSTAEIAASIKQLCVSQAADAIAVRESEPAVTTAEEPITRRLKRQMEHAESRRESAGSDSEPPAESPPATFSRFRDLVANASPSSSLAVPS
jgi:N12 class adenine-specific DNA methylase